MIPKKVEIGDTITWKDGTVETVIRVRNRGTEWQVRYSYSNLGEDDEKDDMWWNQWSYTQDHVFKANEARRVSNILKNYGI